MILVNSIEIEQNHFSDGALHMNFALNSLSRGIAPINIKWYYENDGELFTIICLAKKFADHKKTLYMPYCPHARMDRVKDEEDTFTLKYFCEVINSLNFKLIHVRDAHSNVSLALLNNVSETPIQYSIKKAIDFSEAEILFFPDEGAMKRYSEKANLPYAFGMKKRDWTTGKILGLDIVNAEIVKDKKVLIVDDICSRGGTFYHSAKALKEAGASNVSLYVSHLEETVLLGDLPNSGLIDHIYTTKSIFPEKEAKNWEEWITIIE